MAVGLSHVNYCDFVVFTFKCIIITRVELITNTLKKKNSKLNQFYKYFRLPGILL